MATNDVAKTIWADAEVLAEENRRLVRELRNSQRRVNGLEWTVAILGVALVVVTVLWLAARALVEAI